MSQTVAVTREIAIPKGARRIFRVATKQGVVFPGYSGIDYLRHAINNYGWECTVIGGAKGSAKSCLLLQRGYAIYKDWETTLEYTKMEPENFVNALDSRGRIPWIGYDDVTVHLPRSIYFTDRGLWAEISKNWAAYRTKLNCFDCTAPRKDRVASFILEDLTGDIICFNRYKDIESHYDFQRWLWQRDLHDPKKMYATAIHVEAIPFPLTPGALKISAELTQGKIVVGAVEITKREFFTFEKSGLMGVPRSIFKRYWKRRLELADKAAKRLKELFKKRNPEPVPQSESSKAASLLAKKRWEN